MCRWQECNNGSSHLFSERVLLLSRPRHTLRRSAACTMRRLLMVAGIGTILFLTGIVYLRSPLSKSTGSLRVLLESPPHLGYRAALVNNGYLPIFVGLCETTEEGKPYIVLDDVIEHWDRGTKRWETALRREGCYQPAEGTVEKPYTRSLLWPGHSLRTPPFYPNVGFPGSPFQHGTSSGFLFVRSSQIRVPPVS
jgi:hypothetical protein